MSQYLDKNGAYSQWRTYPAIYSDFMDVIEQSQGGETPAPLANCNQFGAWLQLPSWRIHYFSELGGAIFTPLLRP